MRPHGFRAGRLLIFFVLLGLASIQDASANKRDMWEIRPPIGVFGEAVHAAGDFKISYRVQRESFEGLMDGGHALSQSGTMAAYPGGSIPTALRSTSHVVELVWKPGDDWVLLVTLPFIDREVDQIDVTTGQGYSLAVRGFGDVIFSTLYKVYDSDGQRIHLNFGLSLPSGSSNEALATPFSAGLLQRLPYAMQLGSGTLAIQPGVTYNGNWTTVYWGAQMTGTLQAGTNSEGYKLGNEYELNLWLGSRLTSFFAASLRLNWNQSFAPSGQDAQLAPLVSPLADTSALGGRHLDVLFGLDFYTAGGIFGGGRISVEAGFPAYQEVHGPQLGLDWLLNMGIQYAF